MHPTNTAYSAFYCRPSAGFWTPIQRRNLISRSFNVAVDVWERLAYLYNIISGDVGVFSKHFLPQSSSAHCMLGAQQKLLIGWEEDIFTKGPPVEGPPVKRRRGYTAIHTILNTPQQLHSDYGPKNGSGGSWCEPEETGTMRRCLRVGTRHTARRTWGKSALLLPLLKKYKRMK